MHRLAGKAAQARGQGVGFPHRAQVGTEGRKAAVVDRLGKAVSHRQGKARALHQCAQIADFGHRQHAGRQPAGDHAFSLGQACAQFVQGPIPEQNGDEQPIRPQRVAALHKLTQGIIRPVKAHGVDHKIVRAGGKAQRLGILDKPASLPILPQISGKPVTTAGDVKVLLTSISLS